MISLAPCNASSAFLTTVPSFSASSVTSLVTYFSASSKISPSTGNDNKYSANGSKPFFFASVARVFFFSLNGRYISSISASFVELIIAFLISSVNLPFSSIRRITSSLR